MRILIFFCLLLVYSCQVKKVKNSTPNAENSLEIQILKETLAEVLSIDKSRIQRMSDDNNNLILKLSTSFGNQSIENYNGQNIKLITETELETLTKSSGGKRDYLYIQLDKKDEYTFESTASYNCGEMDENNPGKVLSDHFCLGGIVIIFKKDALKLSKYVRYRS